MAAMGVDDIARGTRDLDVDDDRNDTEVHHFMGFGGPPPPAPEIYSPGMVQTDITAIFSKASSDLQVAELIKEEYFTLFESIAALEIMDPKMDSGFLVEGDTLYDTYDVGKPLLPEEVIGIMDQLLCHEMAWQMGHPLCQTVFTSHYIEEMLVIKPTSIPVTRFDRESGDEPLSLRVLRAYCIGLVKTCGFVNHRVKAEHYYEEEDFITHTFHRSLLDEIPLNPIITFLNQTIHMVRGNQDLDTALKEALLARLRFRADFLKATALADDRSAAIITTLWQSIPSQIAEIKESQKLGKPVPDAFSIKLQRKLASTAPPRPMVNVSFESAYEHLERMCQDIKMMIRVMEYHSPQSLMNFVSFFQARKPQPSVYVRTLLQYNLFGEMMVLGSMSFRQLLDDDLASTVLPADKLLDRLNDECEHPKKAAFIFANRMEVFRERAITVYIDGFRIIAQNRCRIRRTLCHLVADWDILQLDAEELDVELREHTVEAPLLVPSVDRRPMYSFPLSSWAYFHKLKYMAMIVQMGFELEIYQPDEICGMYFYLQYLCQRRIKHIERMNAFVRNPRRPIDDPAGQKAHALAILETAALEAEACSKLADGLSCLYAALTRVGLLKIPKRPYSDDRKRYEVRMKPFIRLSLPEPIPFETFKENVEQKDLSTANILNYGDAAIKDARKVFDKLSKRDAKAAGCEGIEDEWRSNVKDTMKACIFASVATSAVIKALAANDGSIDKLKMSIPEAGQGYHDWWVVPKISS